MMLHSLTAEPGDMREYGFAFRKDGGDIFVTVGVQMCTGKVKKIEHTEALTLDEWREVFDFIHGNERGAMRRTQNCPGCGKPPLTLCIPGCVYAGQRNT